MDIQLPKKGDLVSISETGCECIHGMETVIGSEREILFGPREWDMKSTIVEDLKKWIPEHVLLLIKNPEVLLEEGICFVDTLYGNNILHCTFSFSSFEELQSILTIRAKGGQHK